MSVRKENAKCCFLYGATIAQQLVNLQYTDILKGKNCFIIISKVAAELQERLSDKG